MKKIITAAGLAAVCASGVQAQSSVTVYGIIDAGYVGGNSRVVSPTTGAETKTTVSQFGQNAESSSRIGLKGIEDLGGGSSAFFTTEFQIYPQDANLGGNANNGLFNRQSFVGLKKNGIGQVALGLQYTPIFNAGLATDPGNFNNLTGNVIYASAQGIASASAGTSYIGFTARTANTLSFKTDSIAGFTASGIYTLNNKNETQTTSGATITGGNTNASGWGLGVDYTYNKFYAAVAYQASKQFTTADTASVPSTSNSHEWTNAQANGASTAPTLIGGNALNVQDNQFYAGTTYDFGILKAYAQYLNRKATSTISSGYYLGRSAEQIGLRSYITPAIEAWASAGLGRYTYMGSGSPTANFNGWQAGSNYWLSKRTNLYAIYGQTTVSNSTTSTGKTVSAGLNNYAIGMRHTF
ncbi:porin [Polynucleobacter paneuropaeus]|nr:porin [Polynucleobacter paneuropaeus]